MRMSARLTHLRTNLGAVRRKLAGPVARSPGRCDARAGDDVARPRPLRVICNMTWFEARSLNGRPVESIVVDSGGVLATVRLFLRARACDAAVFNVDERRLLLFCLLKRLVGMKHCRLVSVDIHLTPPRTTVARGRARVVGWLLREVDLFLCYFKATEPMQRAYRLDPRRITYVPFKVNAIETVRATRPTDDGFALVCGRSDRDYRTLAAAAAGLDIPIVVLTGPDHTEHGVDVGTAMPPNVRVHSDDGSVESWIRWIARSRFVILPVLPNVLKPSGISAYLEAMALGKCVITSESPATEGLIDSGQAVLVRPGDPYALRDAITHVARDPEYRERVAAAGKAYASALGGETRLADDIARCVAALVEGARLERSVSPR